MLRFTALFQKIRAAQKVDDKNDLVRRYLMELPDHEKDASIALLLNHQKHTLLSMSTLVILAESYKNYPQWLIKRSNETVKDWSETICLMVINPDLSVFENVSVYRLLSQIDTLKAIKSHEEDLKKFIYHQWQNLPADQLYIFHKIITGTWKALYTPWELSQLLAASYSGDIALIGMRMNDYVTSDLAFDDLIDPVWTLSESRMRPPEFTTPVLAQTPLMALGHPAQWIVEPFIHGLRVQIHKVNDKIMLWAEPQYWIEPRDPELKKILTTLPGHCILEAIIRASGDSRKTDNLVSPDDLLLVDILHWGDSPQDLLGDLVSRKSILDQWLSVRNLALPPIITHKTLDSWDQLMSKPLHPGHIVKHGLHSLKSPLWYRIKPPAAEILTALMYAELPNQIMESEYHLTVGLRDQEDNLVPVAKLSSTQLSETTKTSLYYWIQNNTIKRFGPVRLLRSGQVFKISFERIEINKKLKSGVKLIHIEVLENYLSTDVNIIDNLEKINNWLSDQAASFSL